MRLVGQRQRTYYAEHSKQQSSISASVSLVPGPTGKHKWTLMGVLRGRNTRLREPRSFIIGNNL